MDYGADKSKADTSGSISQPDLSPALVPRCRAIKDTNQARNIIRVMESASRERNMKNARIMAKYNSEKPFRQSELDNEGLGWKSNFTTKPLPMLIDKVSPRFTRALEGVKYLTNSALPDNEPGAAIKTEAFRREITALSRGRAGWNDLVASLAQENALFGWTILAWLDEFTWFPDFFRQDQCFVPTGTLQNAESSQVIILKKPYLIHELFGLISDKEAAQNSGWDVKNTTLAINNAIPEGRRSGQGDWERVHEDLIREANVGLSHEAGALTVTVYHLLAREVTGKVSHYALTETTTPNKGYESENRGELLFEREDQFESMAYASAFFSFQHGNGKLHGSKGIGREIYGMAGIVDRSRNEVVDRLSLAGKVLIQCEPKAIARFKMSVVGNALLIGQEYNISQQKIESGVEEFVALDQFLSSLLDQMAGSTTPKQLEGERVTKAQVDLYASREEETRDNVISRFLNQFATMMTTMQARMCDANTSDEDAKAMQARLLKIMTREELDILAKRAVAETVQDFTEIERQKIAIIADQAKGNPLYNQREIERRKVTALIDEEFADAVLLPEGDPTIVAEQTRMQMMENLILVGQGSTVPVSPRDNHIVHLQAMASAMESAGAEATKGGEGLMILQALVKHGEDHYNAAVQSGMDKEKLAPIGKFLSDARNAIAQIEQAEQQAKEELKQQIATTGELPPELAGQAAPGGELPPQAPPAV